MKKNSKKDGIKSDDFDKQNHHLIGENTFGERYDRFSKNLENDSDSDEFIETIRTVRSTQQNLTNIYSVPSSIDHQHVLTQNYHYRQSHGIVQSTVRTLSTVQPHHKSNMYAQISKEKVIPLQELTHFIIIIHVLKTYNASLLKNRL